MDAKWENASQHQQEQLRASSVEQHGERGGHSSEREGGDGADQSDCQTEEGAESSEGDRSTSALCVLLDSLEQQQQKLQLTSALGPAMDKLRSDLAALLKGKGGEADVLLKRLDNITKEEKVRLCKVRS